MEEKFIKWFKRYYWTPLCKRSILEYCSMQKKFLNPEVQNMFAAWKAGRKSK